MGTVETWTIENKSGGWFHPLHIHLVDFKVLSRNGGAGDAARAGPKDVVYTGENEIVKLLVRFDGLGKYMVHCHNLVHEDHDMMTQFEVVGPTARRATTPCTRPSPEDMEFEATDVL